MLMRRFDEWSKTWAKGTIMANAKQQREAKDSEIARRFERGERVSDIMRVTGTNYTRVHETLVTAGLVTDPE
jgi:hypothetical protein